MGYHRAGFDEIVGVDIVAQPDYPFEFVQVDAIQFLRAALDQNSEVWDLGPFDLVHASPPCQAFSTATPAEHDHPDLIPETRGLLHELELHHVIENVRAAPIRRDLILCGSMFGLQVQRHRWFELTWSIMAPPCSHQWDEGRPWTVTGDIHRTAQIYPHSMKPSRDSAGPVMGIDWMSDWRSVTEAIPPAYTEYIGRAFLEQRV